MELTFLVVNNMYSGDNPNMVHMPDNSVWTFKMDSGRLKGYNIVNPAGDVDWENLTVGDFTISTKDKSMSLVRLKNIPRMGVFGTWKQDQILDEENVVTPERHRFAIWGSTSDVSKYLDNCTVELHDGNPVSSVHMQLENPGQILSGEYNSLIAPGMRIELFITLGDSEDYPVGVHFVDRVGMSVTKGNISVEGRSITGKLLKDQTLDSNNVYTKKVYRENVIELLENAGIADYSVQPAPETPWEYGIEFSPNKNMLDALSELIKASLNWKVIETWDGEVVAGSTVTFEDIQVNSRYTFNHGSEVFSRSIVRDDGDVYSKVCCYYSTETIDEGTGETVKGTEYVYSIVDNDADWEVQQNKTLYVSLPKNTDSADAQAIADDLVERINSAGIVETFIGPVRPHLLPGDEAEIVSENGTRLLGLVTTVRHKMGKEGFITEFVVDSGGRIGKSKIKDYIKSLSQSTDSGTVL